MNPDGMIGMQTTMKIIEKLNMSAKIIIYTMLNIFKNIKLKNKLVSELLATKCKFFTNLTFDLILLLCFSLY